jgi:replicative DNA helicase
MANHSNNIIFPTDLELERSVIGYLINSPEKLNTVTQIINAKSFDNEFCIFIYEIMDKMYFNGQVIDLLSLTTAIRKKDSTFTKFFELSEISSFTTVKSGIEQACMHLAELSIRRQLITMSAKNLTQLQDVSIDLSETIDSIERNVITALNPIKSKSTPTITQIADEYLQRLNKIQETNAQFLGISTGYSEIDRITNGLIAPDMIIIAARPSMGKTAIALNMAKHVLNQNKGVLLFSLEMSNQQIFNRFLVLDCENTKIGKKVLFQDEIDKLMDSVSDICCKNIIIDDTAGLSLKDLKSKSRVFKAKYGIDCILIDYIGLMKDKEGKHGNREQEVAAIARGIKELAKELEVPIIVLSQLNRAVESRPDKRPNLSDLRESGAIEQDADIVILLNRPEKYGIEEIDGIDMIGKAEIIIAKNRNGAIDNVLLEFNHDIMKFSDIQTINSF